MRLEKKIWITSHVPYQYANDLYKIIFGGPIENLQQFERKYVTVKLYQFYFCWKCQHCIFWLNDEITRISFLYIGWLLSCGLIYLLYREQLCSGLNERISKRSVHCKQKLFNNITKIICYIDRYLHYQENPEEKKGDRRYTRKIEKTKRQLWEKQIRKDRSDFVMGNSMKVCSNHFVDGEPTDSNTVPCSQWHTVFKNSIIFKFIFDMLKKRPQGWIIGRVISKPN